MSRARLGALLVLCSLLFIGFSCRKETTSGGGGTATDSSGQVVTGPHGYDLAKIPGNWIETKVDVFPGMDGITLQPGDPNLPGRIVWNIWVGDSGLMWDFLARNGVGTADLLKTIDSRRHNERFLKIGIINQPGYMQAPKPDQYGLFIDVPDPNDPVSKLEDQIDKTTYGYSTGVIGLRYSKNPAFTADKEAEWKQHIGPDGVNHDFYENPNYYNRKDLVRPYVVGMACSFCHVSFDPRRPPENVNKPKWENLNDYVGAQYFRVAEVFVPRRVKGGAGGQAVSVEGPEENSFVWQLINSNPPGTLDTSFIATDYLNNPGTMNGVFNLPQRISRAAAGVTKSGQYDPMVEQLSGGALNLKWLTLDKGQKIPRILKQGDDSVGLQGALSRVYVNIGHAWPEWQKHFRPLVGGATLENKGASQSPVPVKALQMNSPSWNWSEDRSGSLANYLIKYAQPLLLKDAPGGPEELKKDEALIPQGKIVFAENCAACHSSKQPPFNPFTGPGQISQQAKDWFKQQIQNDPAYLTDNFLSDERRHAVTEIGTNSTRAAATNATRGHIWDNFSSETYKNLPPIGKFMVENKWAPNGQSEVSIPYPGEPNGPGYYRPPSLISLWSSAPYLHNNAVGEDPMKLTPGKVDTKARLQAFQDGIEKMLWIRPRGQKVWTTTQKSYINIPLPYLPDVLQDAIRRHPELVDQSTQSFRIGPIPQGTPINLLSNTNLDPGLVLGAKRLDLIVAVVDVLARIKRENMNDAQVRELMRTELVPKFLALNKCPDFIEDKGHPFGRNLSMDDKRALIALLKTF